MTDSILTTTILPLALAIVMLGLGLTLTLADFARVAKFPKAVAVGLLCQMLLLPALCYFIAKGFGLAPALAAGLMLLAASPGGPTANLFSHLSKGDVALNITLTAVNSILALLTLPLIVNFALEQFTGNGQSIPLQFKKVIEVCVIVLGPVAIGMAVRARSPGIATRLEKPVRLLSALVLVLVIAGAILKEKDNLGSYFAQVGLAALVFNLASMAVGYLVPALLGVPRRQSTAISMEIGIHNGTMAIFIALSVLKNSEMSIPAAVYSLIMFGTASAFGVWAARRNAAGEAAG